MTENEARYIVRMIESFKENTLFLDATTEDEREFDRMKERYREAGRWSAGSEAALSEFILRVAENGVPGGKYLSHGDELDYMDLWLGQRGIPRIVRPE